MWNYLTIYFYYFFSRYSKNLFLFTDLIFKFFSVFAFFLLGFAAPAVYAKKWKDGVADPSCFQVKMISYFYSIIYRFEYGVPCFSIHFILLVRIVLFGMLRMQLVESWRAIIEGWWFWQLSEPHFKFLLFCRGPIAFWAGPKSLSTSINHQMTILPKNFSK